MSDESVTNQNDAAIGQSDSTDELEVRLRRHIRQMAPHHREREAGKLLIDALDAIIMRNNTPDSAIPSTAELEVIATRCEWPRWHQYHDKNDPMPTEWDGDPPQEVMQLCALTDALSAIGMRDNMIGNADKLLLIAGARVNIFAGSDTAEWLADEVERLRAQVYLYVCAENDR